VEITFMEPDGSILDSITFNRKGRASLSTDDARRVARRRSYNQQRHVQAALSTETISRTTLQGEIYDEVTGEVVELSTDEKKQIGRQIRRRLTKKDEPFTDYEADVLTLEKIEKRTKEMLDDGYKLVPVYVDEEGRPPPQLCGRFALLENVSINQNAEGVCHVGSVRRCGSVWACPVCGSKILRERAGEIKKAVEHFGNAPKWMVTLTARHSTKTELASFIKAFREARRRLAQSKPFRKFRKEAAGYVTSAEITWSPRNGWHWHVHELWFDAPKPDFAAAWQRALGVFGLSCVEEIGYDVRESWDASEYLAKTGIDPEERTWDTGKEMSTASKGKGIWDLAAARHYNLVREHYHATRGMRRITWSKGLKALVAVNEVADEDMLEEEGQEILQIQQYAWSQIHSRGLVPDILESAEIGGARYIVETITAWMKTDFSTETIVERRKQRHKLHNTKKKEQEA